MQGEETPGRVSKSFEKQRPPTNIFKEATIMAVKEKIRIRLKGYDHQLVDQSAERIVATAKRTGARVSGPVPLPTEKQVVTILRAVHNCSMLSLIKDALLIFPSLSRYELYNSNILSLPAPLKKLLDASVPAS